MSQTDSETTTYVVDCPLCWFDKSRDDEEVAERHAAVHNAETGHNAEVVAQ